MGRSPRFTPALAWVVLLAALTAVSGIAVLPDQASAQIVINEICADPTADERVEIYNAGTAPVDVTGWVIHDLATIDGNPAPARCTLPGDFDTSTGCSGSAIIQPGEYRVIKGTSAAAWLNNPGDTVYLCSSAALPATIVDQTSYGDVTGHANEVWARLPNGTGAFAWRAKTMCASNAPPGDVTAPATVTNLVAGPGNSPGEIQLLWTAPGDDGMSGTATGYEVKISTAPINSGNFAAATDIDFWINEPLPRPAGAADSLYVFGLNPATTYYFALRTLDEVPNLSGVSNSPSSAPFAGTLLDPDLGFSAYFGTTHSHTGYSDGVQTPAAAFNYARNTAQTPLDFLCVTDHNHSQAGMSLPNYHLGMSEAAAANDDGDFVAIYGQEWGLAANGHVNIFESPALFGWEANNYDVLVAQSDYAGLYTAALANPPASYPPIALWCHPATTDFSNMQVTTNGLSLVHLMCLVNGPATSTATDESDIGNTNFDPAFHEALRKGYRVSPTGDQDNHNATWGASSESRTAVLANAKTKSAILNAMAARRTYATQDHNVVVHFSADGREMGRAFTSAGARIAVEVTDPDVGESVAQIELLRGFTGISAAVPVAHNIGNSTFQWRERQTFAAGTEAHYYLRIRMADNQSIWTGPVYVTYEPVPPAAVGDLPSGGAGLALSAHPIPSYGSVTAELTLPHAEDRATLAVYDLSGRHQRTLLNRPLDAGVHRVTWDRRTEDGTRSGAGIFFLRLETSAGRVERKVLLLR